MSASGIARRNAALGAFRSRGEFLGGAAKDPWAKIEPKALSLELAKISGHAANLVGLFSLFAITAVFSGIAGDKVMTWEINAVGTAEGLGWRLHIPWLPFLIAGAFGVWLFNRHGLRILLALKGWKRGVEDGTPVTKTAVLIALIGFSMLIITTATKFQDEGRVQDAREAAVTEQTARRAQAAVQTDLNTVVADLQLLTQEGNLSPSLLAEAARAGEESWRGRIAAAQTEATRLRREAELPTAIRADALRARRDALQDELATAPVEAETAATVAVDRGGTAFITGLFGAVPFWFAVATEFLALLMKLVEAILLRRAQLAHEEMRAQEARRREEEAEAARRAAEAPKDEPQPTPDLRPDPGPDLGPEPAEAAAPEPPPPPTDPDPKPKRRNKPLPAPTAAELAALRPEPSATEDTFEEAA